MDESGHIPDVEKTCHLNSRKIKICRIATVSYYLVSQLKAQAEYLEYRGMKVVLISSDGSELSKLNLSCNLTHEVVDIPRSIKPWKDICALLALIKTFRKHKFDIVHSTTPKAGLLTSIAAFLLRVPVRLHTWTGQRWINLKGPLRWVSIFSDKIIGLLNTRCYADSKSQRNFLLEKKIIVPQKLHVIGHGSLGGVDLNCFNPERWSRPEKEAIKKNLSINPSAKVLIFLGRMSRDKGIVELISAFKKLIYHNYNVDLLLVGPRDQDCGGADPFSLSEVDQNHRIHYIGYTKHPERFLAISDIHCLPSYREGFGTVVIEAAAMGIPTVGTQINGLVDAVDNGKTGILVPDRDKHSLFNVLCKMLDDPEFVDCLGIAARKRCKKQFDSNFVNKLVLEEYFRLLKKIVQKK